MSHLSLSRPVPSTARFAPFVLPLLALLVAVAAGIAVAAGASESCPLHERHTAGPTGEPAGEPSRETEAVPAAGHSGMDAHPTSPAGAPAETGEAAFAALAEMARRLEADPSVDWNRVRLDRLREHLVDMHRVSSEADVAVTDLEDGFRARVTAGDPRTAAAIGRMLPAHARALQGHRGWRIELGEVADAGGDAGGVLVTVRAADPAEAERLRGLGFSGFLVSGDHHRPHHQAMVLGFHP